MMTAIYERLFFIFKIRLPLPTEVTMNHDRVRPLKSHISSRSAPRSSTRQAANAYLGFRHLEQDPAQGRRRLPAPLAAAGR
jgi:hypothetical protein